MSNAKVRRIEHPDETQWRSLWDAYNRFYGRAVAERTTERTWRTLKEGKGPAFGFVVETAGRLVGFTHFFFVPSTSDWAPRCYMQDLFADPSVRGQGVGRALIEAVYTAADDQEASQVYWLTDAQNSDARKLYDRVASLTPFIKYKR